MMRTSPLANLAKEKLTRGASPAVATCVRHTQLCRHPNTPPPLAGSVLPSAARVGASAPGKVPRQRSHHRLNVTTVLTSAVTTIANLLLAASSASGSIGVLYSVVSGTGS